MSAIINHEYDFGMGEYVFTGIYLLLLKLLDELTKETLVVLDDILDRTFFLLPERSIVVKKAFRFLALANTSPNQVNYYHRILCALLPQLEHGLRRIYVAVNKLPE